MIILLAYFPSLYPDEIIYSAIARYHQVSGNISQRQTIRDLFGERLVCATVDLPSHLSSLSGTIENMYTAEELIEKHTLYPYYTAYVPKDKAEKLYRLMSVGTSRGEAHVLLGVPASKVKLPANLRYCVGCYRDDIKKYGEPYWHRLHQLPGVLVCPIHQTWLCSSTVPYTTRDHKFGFQPLSAIQEGNESNDLVPLICLRVAQRSELLLSRSFRYVDSQSLIENKYITNEGRIRFRKLLDDFDAHCTTGYLETINSEVKNGLQETWLHKIIRGRGMSSHPLRYLLLSDFLGLDITENIAPLRQHEDKKSKQVVKSLVKGNPTKDWVARDRYFRSEVGRAVSEMKMQKSKPQRITVAAISRHIGRTEYNVLLEKCLNKLPLTKRYILQELESTEEYQLRRLECAASVMKEQGIKIQGWRLLKAAGLNHPLAKEVEVKFRNLGEML